MPTRPARDIPSQAGASVQPTFPLLLVVPPRSLVSLQALLCLTWRWYLDTSSQPSALLCSGHGQTGPNPVPPMKQASGIRCCSAMLFHPAKPGERRGGGCPPHCSSVAQSEGVGDSVLQRQMHSRCLGVPSGGC